jgi:UDP-glucose 4,6-dehydratase
MSEYNEIKFKNVLVTGGCGFIGSNFINYMLNKYPSIFILNVDRLDYCASEDNIEEVHRKSERYRLVVSDINNKEFMLSCLQRYQIDTIVHFAAQSHVDNSFGNSIQFTLDNVLGTHTLLECTKVYHQLTNKLSRFLHISTDEVYGERKLDDPGCEEEKSILDPTSPYAASKAAAEFMVKSYYHSFKLPIIIIRGNNVMGPRQYPEKLIPRFTMYLLEGKKCPIQGTGQTRRNFIYVDDVCNAVDIIVNKGKLNNIYNIGSEYEYSVKEILSLLIKELNITSTIEEVSEYVEDRAFNDFRYTVDCKKLKNLGWELKYSFEEGLKKTVEWYLQTNKNIQNKTD